jgi:hypothetical protein
MSITERADHHIGPTPDPTEVIACLGSRDTETPKPQSGLEPDGGPRTSWSVLALAAQILVVRDITVVNTALPTIGRSLRLGSADVQCSPWAGPKLTAGCRSEHGQQGRGGDSAAA